MSAYVVCKDQIDLIISAAIEASIAVFIPRSQSLVPVNDQTAALVGQMIWAENVRSVAYRYAHNSDVDTEADWQEVEAYRFRRYTNLKPAHIAKLIDNFDYQACETPNYCQTPTAAFIKALKIIYPRHTGTPEDEAAPWGLYGDDAASCCEPQPMPANVVSLDDRRHPHQTRH